jgi:hypothetical protein
MNFTELEYVLMIAVFALLWRNSSMKTQAMREEDRANKYARWLMCVHDNRGKIVRKEDGFYFEEIK